MKISMQYIELTPIICMVSSLAGYGELVLAAYIVPCSAGKRLVTEN